MLLKAAEPTTTKTAGPTVSRACLIADLANASGSAHAGAVTAALFLRRFVPQKIAWAHLDTYAWRDRAKPGRPKGGEALGLRAIHAMLEARFPA